ncbi:RNA polymerase sigma-70 factor, ECF subfamily [Filimonas lacunae]|uniref:RNA polymerase sigma-70 factor, ECF subfamily n=1 Tax=Filimonas lacunae TaxID=477680 RepID=A0A173MHJ1_9BACT|nr:sigma-70 family RNA polymerase sigma factor [Filimonas lacunae]BAV07082.1 RNA polymerase ECF-type sigma factor [Filimonas lacunae]SIS95244.1 RNA polymerase sigma-70 factor, ECF subfamily [Filimonas lacunae]
MNRSLIHTEKEELVRALKKGDEKAFSRFFDEFYAPLFYYSRHLVREEEEAKDIVLTSLYKCWERRGQFEQYQHVKSFLYLVVRNAGLNFLKKEQRDASRFHEFLLSANLVEQEDDYLATEAEVLKRVYKAVEALPDKCRRVFELTYLEEKSVGEIAALLQITPANVSVQRHRAVQLLRLALADAPLALIYLFLILEKY